MKKFSPILILLMASLAFSSCEKVIEVNLDDSASVIVIEATITNNKEPFSVLVSKTTPYFGTTTSTLVSGATVSVRAENGEPKYFNESSPGVYNLEKTIAQPNYWYIVDVEYEGITYSARSYLNEFVPITDFSISHFDGLGFVESGYKICCFIKDPPGIDNYYRMKILVNGKTVTDDGEFNLYSDELFDGKEVGLVQQSAVFQETDTITIELQSIDEATYNYFNTLETISGIEILQSASPSNPTSNFDNDALGYFSAYSFDRKTLVVSEFIGK